MFLVQQSGHHPARVLGAGVRDAHVDGTGGRFLSQLLPAQPPPAVPALVQQPVQTADHHRRIGHAERQMRILGGVQRPGLHGQVDQFEGEHELQPQLPGAVPLGPLHLGDHLADRALEIGEGDHRAVPAPPEVRPPRVGVEPVRHGVVALVEGCGHDPDGQMLVMDGGLPLGGPGVTSAVQGVPELPARRAPPVERADLLAQRRVLQPRRHLLQVRHPRRHLFRCGVLAHQVQEVRPGGGGVVGRGA